MAADTPVPGATIAFWKEAVTDGSAAARCDEIVRRGHAGRGVPMRLAEALIRLPAVNPVTPRELDVLACAARRLTVRESAERLGLAVETIKQHRKHAIRKLGARNTRDAVELAIGQGLIAAHERAEPRGA